MQLLHTLLFCCCASALVGQHTYQIDLVAHRNDYAAEKYNDVWAYVAPDGTEYAILGGRRGAIVYSIAAPETPQEVAFVPGAYSTWRDFYDWEDRIFFTTDEGADGLGIIEMGGVPGPITWSFWKPELDITLRLDTMVIGFQTDTLKTCHNIWIDDNGICYLSGCNLNEGGVLIFDIKGVTPVFLGSAEAIYSHDIYVRNDTIWSANLYAGTVSVFDATVKSLPKKLAEFPTSTNATHNCWMSDDGRYLFTTDEIENGFVDAYDISDLQDIRRLDSYQPLATAGLGVIPHNTHYKDGFLITSWFSEGMKVLDARRPGNLIEVAAYDTYPGPDGGFGGCWGAYPYLPSGLILASDVQTGLYVFQPQFRPATHIEGRITDASTGLPLPNVKVEIMVDFPNKTITDALGRYQTGFHEEGKVQLRFSKVGYERILQEVELQAGALLMIDLAMVPAITHTIQGRIFDKATQDPVNGAQIQLSNDLYEYHSFADEKGQFTISEVYAEAYELIAGQWGYLATAKTQTISPGQELHIALNKGYEDDFVFDLGWTTTADSNTTAGFWEWGVPLGTSYSDQPSHPATDLPNDLGTKCYSTGNGGGTSSSDDVDNGHVQLYSPIMDLSAYQNPILTYHLWFFNFGGEPPQNDSLSVWVTNGIDTVLVETLKEPGQSFWQPLSEIALDEYIAISNRMQVILETGDPPPIGHIVEAAIDGFAVRDSIGSTPIVKEGVDLRTYPNPFYGTLRIEYQIWQPFTNAQFLLYNSLGQKVEAFAIEGQRGIATFSRDLPSGLYYLSLMADQKILATKKLIKIPPKG